MVPPNAVKHYTTTSIFIIYLFMSGSYTLTLAPGTIRNPIPGTTSKLTMLPVLISALCTLRTSSIFTIFAPIFSARKLRCEVDPEIWTGG